MRKKKVYEDDDGRTICPMDGVPRHAVLGTIVPPTLLEDKPEKSETEQRQHPELTRDALSRKEQRWLALGALRAALLIALAYIVGLGAVIALIVLLFCR